MPRFLDPDALGGLALREGADIHSPLLRALVDLYLQRPNHSTEEERHFTELVLRLLDQADVETRLAVARRLMSYPAVPVAVMHRLVDGVPAIAAVVAEAERAKLARQVPIITAEPPTASELSELFFAASADERRLILVNLAHINFDHVKFVHVPPPVAEASDHAEVAQLLEQAALSHQPDAFMRGLERWLGVTSGLAYRIVHDPLGEPIVVVAKGLGMSADALQRILLFLNPIVGRSVERLYNLSVLFEAIEIGATRTLVAIWRAAEPQPVRRTRPQPADESERTKSGRRLPAATTIARRPAANLSARANHGKR